MRTSTTLILLVILLVAGSCSQKSREGLVLVKGGTFKDIRSSYYGKGIVLPDLYIAKYEVTQKEWFDVMGSNPSTFKGEDLPVETVSWYDCVEYCNKRSSKEGLHPCYLIDRSKKDQADSNDLDDMKWSVTILPVADGYRLPTETEWEYAAGGGQISRSFTYSGGDNIDEVAWYWKNSGDQYLTGNWSWPLLQRNHNRTNPVGGKEPNELGLYDMSGNVREWCWDSNTGNGTGEPFGRLWKGGGWMGADFCCVDSFRAYHEANGKGADQGLRVVRNRPVK